MTDQHLTASSLPSALELPLRRRMHIALFLPLCLLASAAGGFATFVAWALISTAVASKPTDAAVAAGLLTTILGAVLPLLLLALARGRRPQEVNGMSARPISSAVPQWAEPTLSESLMAPSRIAYPERDLTHPLPLTAAAFEQDVWMAPVEDVLDHSNAMRIVDWGFFSYPLLFVLVAAVYTVSGAILALLPIILVNLICCAAELRGVVITDSAVTYPVRLVLLRFYAVPLFRRTVHLDEIWEASAETQYRRRRADPFPRIRLLYLSGSDTQARIWFSGKGRRDWLFAQLRNRAPHVRQYRGR